ncbi:MAG: glycosyltransferase family 4 protein [Acidobacteria bacterium]|nr:glycosyltransferase family 4 protein [Acidobacteriota bacterium]
MNPIATIPDCSEQQQGTMQTMPSAKRRAFVVGCDVKRDIRVFSGTTYHLAQQGVEDGLLTGMINLFPKGLGAWRTYARAGLWRLSGGFHGRHGFKFTDGYLNSIWKSAIPAMAGATVINNFQLFGSYFWQSHRAFGIQPYFYIDGTLTEYFGHYREFDAAEIDKTAIRDALALEREGYASCRKIAVMSKRTAANIIQHYAVPQHKIHVVPPGANIPEPLLQELDRVAERRCRPGNNNFVVGFIGLYPERKGLPTIAEAISLLRSSGYDIRLHVIGKCPPNIAQQGGVTYFGLIDKSIDIKRFIDIIRSIDLGCMLSRAEMAGVALMEFLRLGVPIIATDVGGIPDIIGLGAGQVVPPEISPRDLAQYFAQLMDKPERLTELKDNAWRRRHNASWRRVVKELTTVLDG